MSTVILKPCMALDAIIYLSQYSDPSNRKYMKMTQKSIYKKIDKLMMNRLDGDYLNMSTLSLIISVYTENKNLENYTLSHLIQLFENIEHMDLVVRQRITNEFTASYVYPVLDRLKDGFAKKYIEGLSVLKDMRFEEYWNKDILPVVLRQINRKQKSISKQDMNLLFENISKLKSGEHYKEVTIFVSMLSYPISFKLYDGCFLDSYYGRNIIHMIAHELMHGFASHELIEKYLEYINTDSYLTKCHTKLIEKFHSGNEEEFVVAAEYYLIYKLKPSKKLPLLFKGLFRYNGCIPFSLLLFSLLMKEKGIPNDYNEWLLRMFNREAFSIGKIRVIRGITITYYLLMYLITTISIFSIINQLYL